MKKELMNFRKWNRKRLILRLLSFPVKLLFQILWGVLSSILISIKWLKNGSQELVYGDDYDVSLVEILEQNKKIIKYFKNNNEP